MEKEETFSISLSCKAQDSYVDKKKYPHFAPMNGKCYHCGNNIYEKITSGKWTSGYSVKRASSELITGCPHCHHSYCE